MHHLLVILMCTYCLKALLSTLNAQWAQMLFFLFLHMVTEQFMWLALIWYRLKLPGYAPLLVFATCFEVLQRLVVWGISLYVYSAIGFLQCTLNSWDVVWRAAFPILTALMLYAQASVIHIHASIAMRAMALSRRPRTTSDGTLNGSGTTGNELQTSQHHGQSHIAVGTEPFAMDEAVVGYHRHPSQPTEADAHNEASGEGLTDEASSPVMPSGSVATKPRALRRVSLATNAPAPDFPLSSPSTDPIIASGDFNASPTAVQDKETAVLDLSPPPVEREAAATKTRKPRVIVPADEGSWSWFTALPGYVMCLILIITIGIFYGAEVIPFDSTIVEVRCKRVAIIGGGVSGLTTAWALTPTKAVDFEVTVYEAAGRYGGSARTSPPYKGNTVEL
jgi:hypothetical protein